MINPRKLAVSVLLKIEKDKAYSNIAVNNMFKESGADEGEKRLASAIVYGVLDRRVTLDYILNSLMEKPFAKTAPYTAQVLRAGLYQILYMDGIPDHSAVDESVKLVKKSGESRNAGFVNAVLRQALRKNIPLPQGDELSEISVRFSCPLWIVESLIADYGIEDTKAILADSLNPAPLIIRANTVKITPEELACRFCESGIPCELCEPYGAVALDKGIEVAGNRFYLEGFFHVQDLASQRAVEVLSPQPGERVLDVCAAPGGKSFTMAEIMCNKGEIVSCDLYPKRVDLIKKGAKRLGLSIITAKATDAQNFEPALGEFDAVLCDVPCSGLGIIRRKPDIKYKEIINFETLEQTQDKIIQTASQYLKSGGRMLYSTCTLRRGENEQRVQKFLKNNPQFCLKYEHTYMPHKDKTDGFYCALIIKD